MIAAQAAPSGQQTTRALHTVHASDPVVSRVSMNHRSATTRLWAVLHPDGTRIAMTGESAVQPASALEVHDARTGALVWEWQPPVGPGHDSAFVAGTAYSPDGKILAGGMVWDPTSPDRFGPPSEAGAPAADGLLGIHLWDADTHEPVGHLDVGPCGGWPLEVSERYVFVRALVPSTDPASAAQSDDPVTPGCQWWRGGWGNYVVDRATGEATLLGVTSPATLQWNLGAALSDDGSVAAVLDQRRDEWAHGDRNDYNSTVLVDTVTGEEIRRIRHTEPVDLDATGEHVLLIESGVDDSNSRGSSTWRVVAVADGRTVATYAGHQGRASYGTFAPDGATVLSAGLDNVLHRWDARTGEEVRQWPSTGSGRPSAAGPRVLVPRSETAGAVLVDTRAPSEGWSVPGCGGLVFPDQLQFVEGLVVVARGCEGFPGQLEVIQPDDEDPVAVADAVWNENLAVFPAGSRVVAQEGTRETADARPVLGSLQGRDLSTGEPLVALEGFCSHPRDLHSASDCARLPAVPAAIAAWTVRWSPDGRWIAAIDGNTGLVAVWEASTGELVAGDIEVGVSAEGFAGPWEMTFTPDSTRLILTTMTAELVAVDVSTWEPVTSARFASSDHLSAAPVGFAEDGSLVVVSPLRDNVAGATLLLADPDTLEVRQTFSGVVGGRAVGGRLPERHQGGDGHQRGVRRRLGPGDRGAARPGRPTAGQSVERAVGGRRRPAGAEQRRGPDDRHHRPGAAAHPGAELRHPGTHGKRVHRAPDPALPDARGPAGRRSVRAGRAARHLRRDLDRRRAAGGGCGALPDRPRSRPRPCGGGPARRPGARVGG